MQTTVNYNLKKPENTDPVDIQDLNDNADILDQEIKKKVNASGGDISETTIKKLDNITTEFPVPEAGEKPGTFLAKVRKFIQDFNNFKTGIITVGKLANNGSTTAAGMALDARYGKTLYDYYAQLNSDFTNFKGAIQSGTISVSAAANGTTEFTVNFPETFAKPPVVVMSVVTSRPDLRSAEPLSRDTKKVTGVVYNGTSASDLSVFWIAIAK